MYEMFGLLAVLMFSTTHTGQLAINLVFGSYKVANIAASEKITGSEIVR